MQMAIHNVYNLIMSWDHHHNQSLKLITSKSFLFLLLFITFKFSSSHVWMWELDRKVSWALKNWAFELWCWRRLLRVLWTAKRSNQSILKEISPEYSLEGLMLRLKLQYFGHLMGRADSLVKTLMLGKIEGRRRRGWQRMRWLDGITHQWTWVWESSESLWWTGSLACSSPWGSKESDTTELLNWTELNFFCCKSI